MISTQAGAYFKGVNVEYNYSFEPGFETQKYDLRAGYGLKLGKSFMLTPQVGYGALAGFDDYGVYRNLHKGILAACRVQMNFGNNFSAAVSPSYHLAIGEVALNASIMFNLPLAK